MNLRGRFWFRSVKPAGYPVPTDSPVGDLLRAQRRHSYCLAHLHVLGYKPGHKTLITQTFVDHDEHLESDVVFGVTPALVGDYKRHDGGSKTPPALDVQAPWHTLDHTFTMGPGEAKRPVPPIK